MKGKQLIGVAVTLMAAIVTIVRARIPDCVRARSGSGHQLEYGDERGESGHLSV